ncbi:MAG: carboxypeptidase-like regulatory domain-containing protein, partial [Bacteroidia bacterium]|nr:carboxypeptidase-like regulatory domain-containing protein [Bacteroidia bacterium]
NLDDKVLAELAEDLPMDGSMNFKLANQQRSSQMYYAGQLPPNNLLNPIAWAKFIQAWKNGDFKRKDNE